MKNKIFNFIIAINSFLTILLYLNLDISLNVINQNITFLIIGISYLATRLFAVNIILNEISIKNDSIYKNITIIISKIFIDSIVIFNVFIYAINPNKIHLLLSLVSFFILIYLIIKYR